MPPEFTPFRKPTGRDKNKPSREPEKLSPSILRDIFEGVVDTGMGAFGVGPDTQANRMGALAGAALPLAGMGKSIRNALTNTQTAVPLANRLKSIPLGMDDAIPAVSTPPIQGGRYGAQIQDRIPTQNSVAMNPNRPMAGSVADSEGRMLGQVPPIDPGTAQYQYYLDSLKKNTGMKMSPERSLSSKMLAPSDERLDKLLTTMGGRSNR